MAHLSGTDRAQLLLLPEAVDDYVGTDNPLRFIEAFVDGLDLAAAGFVRVAAKETGRPGYDPADLLKLYVYGYINRVRSSRRLEAEAHRNIEVIWLLRHLKPDFRTIADFRRMNRSAFKQGFREFVILCRQLDLFGRELLAVDGTRIKAVNNKDRNFTRGALTKFINEADFENWESEFLQMSAYVMLTAILFQRGSAESKDPDEPASQDQDPKDKQHDVAAPWPVRIGGLARSIYSYSLGIGLGLLFVLSFALHLRYSAEDANVEAAMHGQAPISLIDHLGSAQFWFESFQNWQSEFLSTAVLVVLSIFLRFKRSPESKPVAAPHSETGS